MHFKIRVALIKTIAMRTTDHRYPYFTAQLLLVTGAEICIYKEDFIILGSEISITTLTYEIILFGSL